MIATRAVPALLPAHHWRVARPHITLKDFADPLALYGPYVFNSVNGDATQNSANCWAENKGK
jgi:hypothetical protein